MRTENGLSTPCWRCAPQCWPRGRQAHRYRISRSPSSTSARSLRTSVSARRWIAPTPTASLSRNHERAWAWSSEHIKLLKILETEGQADLLPTTIDSYTRQNRYAEAKAGIEESLKSRRSMLERLPGRELRGPVCRQVTEAVDRPIQVRHGTPDARLLAEITLAGGFTASRAAASPTTSRTPRTYLSNALILHWQYVDRLCGHLRGATASSSTASPSARSPARWCRRASLTPSPSSRRCWPLEQGVRSITVGYGQCGNLYQDIAAVRCLRGLCREYLDRPGFTDVHLTTVFHQWMGGFPEDEAQAFAVISWGAVAAAFSNVTKVITKTPHEAMGIPTAQANAAGLRATHQVLQHVQGAAGIGLAAMLTKSWNWPRRETTTLLEATLKLGEGDWATGAVRGLPGRSAGRALRPKSRRPGCNRARARLHGAVRLLEFGSLPFDEDLKAVHRDALAERARAEGRPVSFQMVTDDIYAVSKGRLVGRPR